MKITEIKVSGLLSFGPVQELKDISQFNLLIGKNGSGKSNIFKLLYDLKTDFIKDPISSFQENKYLAILDPAIYNEKMSQIADIGNSLLEISYEIDFTSVAKEKQVSIKDKIIFLNNGVNSGYSAVNVQGAFDLLKYSVAYIDSDEDKLTFLRDLSYLSQGLEHTQVNYLPILSFGIYYIFNQILIIERSGFILDVLSGIRTSDASKIFSSGMLNCIKIISQYLLSVLSNSTDKVASFRRANYPDLREMAQVDLLSKIEKSIILIEEPELNLEPRACKKLIHFLFWMSLLKVEEKDEYAQQICNFVEQTFQEWQLQYSPLKKTIDPQEEAIDPKIFETLYPTQIFISSHSSVLINEFMRLKSSASIYKFDKTLKKYRTNLKTLSGFPLPPTSKYAFSTIRKVDNDIWSILNNLGCKGSDLLQTNGVIWVEGPSDIIYIQKWIELYIQEHNLTSLIRSLDYEFQMYGGAILVNIDATNPINSKEEAQDKLVSMFSFSRNSYVVMDSDAVEEDGEIRDISRFKGAKLYVEKEFRELAEGGNLVGIWYEKDNIKVSTIENYLDKESQQIFHKYKDKKKEAAQKIVTTWGNQKSIADFPNNLSAQIEKLVSMINSWKEL